MPLQLWAFTLLRLDEEHPKQIQTNHIYAIQYNIHNLILFSLGKTLHKIKYCMIQWIFNQILRVDLSLIDTKGDLRKWCHTNHTNIGTCKVAARGLGGRCAAACQLGSDPTCPCHPAPKIFAQANLTNQLSSTGATIHHFSTFPANRGAPWVARVAGGWC